MRLPIISRFVLTQSQLLPEICALKNRGIIPIVEYAVEHTKNNNNDFIINDVIDRNVAQWKAYPNGYHAFKMSSVGFSKNAIESLNNAIETNLPHTNNKLLIDAEEFDIQYRINYIADMLCWHHNTTEPRVYKTYQMYRKDMLEQLIQDLDEYEHHQLYHGIKLVRGAYLHLDKPFFANEFHENKECTDIAYNTAANMILRRMKDNDKLYCIFATHNTYSYNTIAQRAERFRHRVHFATLLGMADELTRTQLKNNPGQVMKHVPYGPLMQTIPYLTRRYYELKKQLYV